jgi:hypothetical protein
LFVTDEQRLDHKGAHGIRSASLRIKPMQDHMARVASRHVKAISCNHRDLKQSARLHYVLEEVDHLILVGEVVVERHRGRQAEQRQHDGNEASLETRDQQQSTVQLDDNGHHEGRRRQADCPIISVVGP